MATANLVYPLYATALSGVLSVIILATVRERGEQQYTATPLEILHDSVGIVRNSVIARHALIVSGVLGSFFFSVKWVYNPWFLELHLPLVWWGAVTAILTLAIAVGTFVARKQHTRTAIYGAGALLVVGTSVSGMTWMPLLAAGSFVCAHAARGFIETHTTVLLNEVVPSHVRASVMSLESLMIRLGAAGVTALSGLMIDMTATWSVILMGVVMFVFVAGYSFVQVAQWQSVFEK